MKIQILASKGRRRKRLMSISLIHSQIQGCRPSHAAILISITASRTACYGCSVHRNT